MFEIGRQRRRAPNYLIEASASRNTQVRRPDWSLERAAKDCFGRCQRSERLSAATSDQVGLLLRVPPDSQQAAPPLLRLSRIFERGRLSSAKLLRVPLPKAKSLSAKEGLGSCKSRSDLSAGRERRARSESPFRVRSFKLGARARSSNANKQQLLSKGKTRNKQSK